MDKVRVKIVNKSTNELPAYQTVQSAGMDLRTNITEAIELAPLERKLLAQDYTLSFLKAMKHKSGLAVGLPTNMEFPY